MVVKALLKIVKLDIEYEISCVYDYVQFLKGQIKRLETIQKWHEEMDSLPRQKDKNYYMDTIKKTFEPNENINNYKQILNEYREAYKTRQNKINLLHTEIEKIKKMDC